MRQQLIDPKTYSPEQRQLAETFYADIAQFLSSFTTSTGDGELIGPFNIMLQQPDLGGAAWKLFTALNNKPKRATVPHEIAILVTDARYGCLYELYSHGSVSAERGIPLAKISTIAAGDREFIKRAMEAMEQISLRGVSQRRLLALSPMAMPEYSYRYAEP